MKRYPYLLGLLLLAGLAIYFSHSVPGIDDTDEPPGDLSSTHNAESTADYSTSFQPVKSSEHASANDPATNNTAATSIKKPIRPDEVSRYQFEVYPPTFWSAQLEPEDQAAFEEFAEALPNFDPTDLEQYHTALVLMRQNYGHELTVEQAQEYAEWNARMDRMSQEMIDLRGDHLGLSTGGIDNEGRGYRLVGFDGPRPLYSYTANVNAAITSGASFVRQNAAFDSIFGPSIDGDGLYVNINDHGTIYDHPEFNLPGGASRIVLKEINDSGNRSHMTHVAGTVAAWGYNSNWIGMAPRVWIRAHIQQYTSDITSFGMQYPGHLLTIDNPVTGQKQMRSVMGTTSLGLTTTNEGLYTSTARSFDQTFWDYPYYIHFYAASNDGSAFSTLGENVPTAKNTITVGSVSDVTRSTSGAYVSGGNVDGFSSRGPTYDGRIKPDLTANGNGLTSTDGTSGSSSKSGTSMATPNASGSTVLLIDYFNTRFPGHFLRAATLKALLINTADDRGPAGPDYSYGWGIINVLRAAEIIKRYAQNPSSRIIVEDTLVTGQTWSSEYQYDGNGPIRVTLAWHDLPGATQAAGDRSPRLINDLNLRIIGPDTTAHMPYLMPFVTGNDTLSSFDPSLRSAPATRGVNTTDNVEQVLIAAPTAGTYTIEITAAGTLSGGSQRFSLAVSGAEQTQPLLPQITSISPTEGNAGDIFALTITGSGFVPGSDVLLRRVGSADAPAYAQIISGNEITCRIDTATLAKGYWDAVVRCPDGTEFVLPNAFLLPVAGSGGSTQTLYSNDFASADNLLLTGGWTVGTPNQASVGGPSSAYAGSNVLGTYLNGNYDNNLNIYATLPAISTINRESITLSFRRWLGVHVKNTGNPKNYDYGRIQYSVDGTTWTNLFSSPSNASTDDSAWGLFSYVLPTNANNRDQLFLRFQLETDSAVVSYGWNIDALNITAIRIGGALPPIFTSTPPETTFTAGTGFMYQLVAADEDTPLTNLTFAAVSIPTWLSFTDNGNGTATLIGTPDEIDSGNTPILISVTDGDYTTYQEFNLRVLPVAGNTPPVFETESIAAAHVDFNYEELISASDIDGDLLVFTSSILPNWITLVDNGNNTASLIGTPSVLHIGSQEITLYITDGLDTVAINYQLAVNPRAEIALTTSNLHTDENAGTVSLTVSRTLNSFGSVSVYFTTSNGTATAGTDYVANSGTLNWEDGELGTKEIVVVIIDDNEREIEEAFTVTLSNITGVADLGTPTSTTVTIQDDDVPAGQTIAVGSFYLIDQGTVSEAGGVLTLTRTGDPGNAFQGYVTNLEEIALEEVGDFVEIRFRARSNTSNNSARQISWGFFNGGSVSSDSATSITDAWTGYLHQIGTRNSSGTGGAAAARQGSGAIGVMDHVGGFTTFDGATAIPGISQLNQSVAVPVTFRLEKINATQLRVTSWFSTPHSGGSSSGSSSGISWNYLTESNTCRFRSIHSLADGPSSFNGFAVASRGDNWTFELIDITSNNPVLVEPELTPAELWRQVHFETTANSGEAADDADPDADGLNNLMERAFASDPLNPNDRSMLTTYSQYVSSEEQIHLAIQFRRLKDPVHHGLTYSVQTSSNMETHSWNSDPAMFAEEVLDSSHPDFDWVQVHLVAPVHPDMPQFLRLEIGSEQ